MEKQSFMDVFDTLSTLNEDYTPVQATNTAAAREAARKFKSEADNGILDIQAFHLAYDAQLAKYDLLRLFGDDGKLANRGSYGTIKNLKDPVPSVLAGKLKKLWIYQFSSELPNATQKAERDRKAAEAAAALEAERERLYNLAQSNLQKALDENPEFKALYDEVATLTSVSAPIKVVKDTGAFWAPGSLIITIDESLGNLYINLEKPTDMKSYVRIGTKLLTTLKDKYVSIDKVSKLDPAVRSYLTDDCILLYISGKDLYQVSGDPEIKVTFTNLVTDKDVDNLPEDAEFAGVTEIRSYDYSGDVNRNLGSRYTSYYAFDDTKITDSLRSLIGLDTNIKFGKDPHAHWSHDTITYYDMADNYNNRNYYNASTKVFKDYKAGAFSKFGFNCFIVKDIEFGGSDD